MSYKAEPNTRLLQGQILSILTPTATASLRVNEDPKGGDEDAEATGEKSGSRSEELQSSYGDAQDSNEESQSSEEEESPLVSSGFKIKLYWRKRKSDDDIEGASSKRSRNDSEANESARRRRRSSIKVAVSRDRKNNGEAGEEEVHGIDESDNRMMDNDDYEEEGEGEDFDNDGSANYTLVSLQDFNARWKEFDEIAKQARTYIVEGINGIIRSILSATSRTRSRERLTCINSLRIKVLKLSAL
jgi:hypothetical protein